MKKWCFGLLTISFIMIFAAGCNSGSNVETQSKVSAEPVNLTMTSFNTSTNEDEFNAYMKPFIEKKYPNIHVEWIQPSKDKQLDSLIAAGQIPDIVASGYAAISSLQQLYDFPLELTAPAKAQKFDWNVFDPVALTSVKIYGHDGAIYSLPYVTNYFALVYNKDLFDKFGVPYPKDSMTWDETLALGKKLSRSEGGSVYKGLVVGSDAPLLGRTLALPLVDPKTDKAVLNTENWLRVTNLLKDVYSLPGNQSIEASEAGPQGFIKGNVAMIANWGQSTVSQVIKAQQASAGFNWDIASYPHFAESNGTMEISTNIYTLSKVSKHPSEAFQIASYLATSPEVQEAEAKLGMFPVVHLDNVAQIFGSSIPEFKGKNVAALFKSQSLKDHLPSDYDKEARTAFTNAFKNVLSGQSDPVSALAAAEDETNKKIAELKAGGQ